MLPDGMTGALGDPCEKAADCQSGLFCGVECWVQPCKSETNVCQPCDEECDSIDDVVGGEHGCGVCGVNSCPLDEAYEGKCLPQGKDSDLCETGGGGGGGNYCSPSSDDACPSGQFCNMDYGYGGVCEACKGCTSTPDAESCFTCGLPWEGAQQCFDKCQGDALTASLKDDNCVACPCGYELDLIDHCKKMNENGECEETCDAKNDEGQCTEIVAEKDRKNIKAKAGQCKTMKIDCDSQTDDSCTKDKPRCLGKCVLIGQATCPMKKVRTGWDELFFVNLFFLILICTPSRLINK